MHTVRAGAVPVTILVEAEPTEGPCDVRPLGSRRYIHLRDHLPRTPAEGGFRGRERQDVQPILRIVSRPNLRRCFCSKRGHYVLGVQLRHVFQIQQRCNLPKLVYAEDAVIAEKVDAVVSHNHAVARYAPYVTDSMRKRHASRIVIRRQGVQQNRVPAEDDDTTKCWHHGNNAVLPLRPSIDQAQIASITAVQRRPVQQVRPPQRVTVTARCIVRRPQPAVTSNANFRTARPRLSDDRYNIEGALVETRERLPRLRHENLAAQGCELPVVVRYGTGARGTDGDEARR